MKKKLDFKEKTIQKTNDLEERNRKILIDNSSLKKTVGDSKEEIKVCNVNKNEKMSADIHRLKKERDAAKEDLYKNKVERDNSKEETKRVTKKKN